MVVKELLILQGGPKQVRLPVETPTQCFVLQPVQLGCTGLHFLDLDLDATLLISWEDSPRK